jgi:L-ascorbate peroxidase
MFFFPLNSLWQDEDAFFRDYAESHKKLSELGFVPSSKATGPKDAIVLAQSAAGALVAAAVVILGYLYENSKRRK